MATVNDSGDEEMADDEFGDFEIFEDDLFFFEDDKQVTDLTAHLKRLLKISKPPYNNPHNIFNIDNFSDSSDDDNNSAAAMQVSSESDNKIEINPYWLKVRLNELQGLGNPVESPRNGTDSMPNLETVSELDDSSIMFILTPLSSLGSNTASLEECLNSFSNKEMVELVMDEGEDGHTRFNTTMLINVEGSIKGIQTELYNSGAFQHMSPYCDHFENYVSIVLKSVTAADKHYFQAIGKGDLHIKLSNGPGTTTILLEDILHCSDMRLTLVSIDKITSAGYKVIFRGPTCKIFDSRDKVIGLINVKNGLYHVDHDVMVNVGMAGEAHEILTVKELH